MTENLITRIRAYANEYPDHSHFADRMLAMIASIESEFSGDDRIRLIGLVAEAFDRFVEVRRHAEAARASLADLLCDQQRLIDLLGFALSPPGSPTLH